MGIIQRPIHAYDGEQLSETYVYVEWLGSSLVDGWSDEHHIKNRIPCYCRTFAMLISQEVD